MPGKTTDLIDDGWVLSEDLTVPQTPPALTSEPVVQAMTALAEERNADFAPEAMSRMASEPDSPLADEPVSTAAAALDAPDDEPFVVRPTLIPSPLRARPAQTSLEPRFDRRGGRGRSTAAAGLAAGLAALALLVAIIGAPGHTAATRQTAASVVPAVTDLVSSDPSARAVIAGGEPAPAANAPAPGAHAPAMAAPAAANEPAVAVPDSAAPNVPGETKVEVALAPAVDADAKSEATFSDLIGRSVAALEAGRLEEALENIDGALAERPASGRALELRADILLQLGRLGEAKSAAIAATSARGKYAGAWFTRGLVHYRMGELDQAQSALERYVELAPNGGRATARALLDSIRSRAGKARPDASEPAKSETPPAETPAEDDSDEPIETQTAAIETQKTAAIAP